MDALAHCVTRGKVRRALQDLPKTLDETYDRIFDAIEAGPNAEEALKVLRWLTYSQRPLQTDWLLEVTGIFLEDGDRFDPDEVLEDVRDVLRLCSSLVTIYNGNEESTTHHIDDRTDAYRWTVRLAHFSVREFLVSSRPRITRYRMDATESNDLLACACLVYLLYHKLKKSEARGSQPGAGPTRLVYYTANYWTMHFRLAGAGSERLRGLTWTLLQQDPFTYPAWPFTADGYGPMFLIREGNPDWDVRASPKPLWIACNEGLLSAAERLLSEPDTRADCAWDVYGTALRAASRGRFLHQEKIVEVLLEKGANCNAEADKDEYPVHVAATNGQEEIVRILLEKGADVNARGSLSRSALRAASFAGHDRIVEMLLSRGADVNAVDSEKRTALHVGTTQGHLKVVQVLLANGADVNFSHATKGTALQIAARLGHTEVARTLIDKGADVDYKAIAQIGSALQLASFGGWDDVVELLLAKGANVHASAGPNGNALQCASKNGHEEVVKLLLAGGADINEKTRGVDPPLTLALLDAHEATALRLIAGGADVNAEIDKRGNALRVASENGLAAVAKALLTKEIGVQPSDGVYKALRCAVVNCHLSVVEVLLESHASVVHPQLCPESTLLQAAASRGFREILKSLLAHGADARGTDGRLALEEALERGYVLMAEMLRNEGASVDLEAYDGLAVMFDHGQ